MVASASIILVLNIPFVNASSRSRPEFSLCKPLISLANSNSAADMSSLISDSTKASFSAIIRLSSSFTRFFSAVVSAVAFITSCCP